MEKDRDDGESSLSTHTSHSTSSRRHPQYIKTKVNDLPSAGDNLPQALTSRLATVSHFTLIVTGRIECAQIFNTNNIYCKYCIVYGHDWELVSGIEEGITQMTQKNVKGQFVWNFPIEFKFRSTNPYGWPQIVCSVYGYDFLGNHIPRGYGCTHLPLSHGSYTKNVALVVPESSSFLQKISCWLFGRHPEFVDPKVLTGSEGRQLVRVISKGSISLKFEVITKDVKKLGYSTSPIVYVDNN